MARGPVNKKQLAIETNYGYLNMSLELLHKSLLDKNEFAANLCIVRLQDIRSALIKLGYFGSDSNVQ